MVFYYLRFGYNLKYFFAATISSFLTSACIAFQNDKIPPVSYEAQTGLKFPESVIDLACLARSFPSHFLSNQDENNICLSQVSKNYTEIKRIDGLHYDKVDESFISNTYPSLGIKGLHLKVFERKELEQDQSRRVFIVIRHQEHGSMLTNEMNEMMSLFGAAATVDREQGNKELFGAYTASSVIRFVRRQLGLDFLPQAISMFNKIQLHYQGQDKIKYVFSGFSAGGLYSIALALYFGWPAITFSSTGAEDIVNIYYSNLFMDVSKRLAIPPIFNFAHESDHVPQLDCQVGTVCLYKSEHFLESTDLTEKEAELLHLSTIFGQPEPHIIEWLHQPERWICSTSDNYNLRYGSCKRERLRWKERIELNAVYDQTIEQDL